MADNVFSRFSQAQISPAKAVGISVAVAIAVGLIWYWVFSRPSYRIPPFEQVKAAQAKILKERAAMSLSIHEDAMADATGRAKSHGDH